MTDTSVERDPIDLLADSFVARFRAGERPSIEEYAQRYPDLADEIRELLPALVELEQNLSLGGATATEVFASNLPRQSFEQIGEYTILREIGRGGMGVVYEAVQQSLGRHVALKVLPATGLVDKDRLERFRLEARSAARLHHTNIVPVFGVGEHHGTHYYAMQFIHGQSLDLVWHELRRLRGLEAAEDGPRPAEPRKRLKALAATHGLMTGRFVAAEMEQELHADDASNEASPSDGDGSDSEPGAASSQPTSSAWSESSGLSMRSRGEQYARSVARVGLQVAEALAYAHSQGVLHRDIKPSNLLLDAKGTVWVTDFGLAKAEGTEGLTQTGEMVGTLRYMAPERFDGWSDPRSDVYGLGATLYEFLTLRPLHHSSNRARLVERILHEPPTPPRRIDPRIPRDLETIVLKAVAKEPAQRYPTADALADDLRRYLADKSILARRSTTSEQFTRWCRRNPIVAGLVAVVALLLITVSVVSMTAVVFYRASMTAAQAAEQKAQEHLAEALVNQARGTRYGNRGGRRFESLDALLRARDIGRELNQPRAWFDRLRNEAVGALSLPDVTIQETWPGFPAGTRWVVPNSHFDRYARSTEQSEVTIHRFRDHQPTARLPDVGESVSPHYFYGPRLLVRGDRTQHVWLWDVGAQPPRLIHHEKTAVNLMDLHPDGRWLALARPDSSIVAYDFSATPPRRYDLPGDPPNGPAFEMAIHPQEPLVVVHSYFSKDIQLRDLRTGETLAELELPWAGGAGRAAWRPDGRYLAVPDGNHGRIASYALLREGGFSLVFDRELETVENNGGLFLAFDDAGDRVVGRGWNGVVHLWNWHTGRALFASRTERMPSAQHPLWEPQGDRVGLARTGERHEQLGVWSAAGGLESYVLPVQPYNRNSHLGFAIDPTSRILVCASADSDLRFYDLETGQELHVELMPSPVANLAFSRAGHLLTKSAAEVRRWSAGWRSGAAPILEIQPGERLPLPAGGESPLAIGRDGQAVVLTKYNGYGENEHAGGWILPPGATQPHWVEKGRSMGGPTISPDNRWVGFLRKGEYYAIQVYESQTGSLAWEHRMNDYYVPAFTSDGRYLVTDWDGGTVFSTGDWRPVRQLGAGALTDVSADGKLAVFELEGSSIFRLVEIETGRELVRIEDPDQRVRGAKLSADGCFLVGASAEGLRVWNLRRIREQLAALGLDWDAPPLPPAKPPRVTPQIEFKIPGPDPELAQRWRERSAEMAAQGRTLRAIAALRRAVEYDDSSAETHDQLARRLLRGAPALRRPDEAVVHARKALALAPENASYRTTLGLALYRAGAYREAAETLEANAAQDRGGGIAGLILAMARERLGESDTAEEALRGAAAWFGQHIERLSEQEINELPALYEEAFATLCDATAPLAARDWPAAAKLLARDLRWADDGYRQPSHRAAAMRQIAAHDEVYALVADDRPHDAELRRQRVLALVPRGAWEKCRSVLEELLAIDAEDHYAAYQLACVLAWRREEAAYRKVAHELCERSEASDVPETLERAAKTGLLREESHERAQKLLDMTRRAVEIAGPQHGNRPWFLMAQALAAYRTGDDAACLETIAQVTDPAPPERVAACRLIQALAELRQGRRAEAVRLRAAAEALLAENEPQFQSGGGIREPSWHDWLIVDLLRRELSTGLEK